MLLDEIIDLLSDHQASLEAALLKTKKLLRNIGHKELVPWVSNELTGYPTDAELPSYRIVGSIPRAHVVWGNREDEDWGLPIDQLSERERKIVTRMRMGSSIGTIEHQVKTYREKQQGLVNPLPPESAGSFQKNLTPGTHILSLWCAINMSEVEGIIIHVRSRLLDFCFDLRDVVGVNAGPQELIDKAATVDTGRMFQTAIFNINTGGGTAVIGSTNIQINNQKDDIEGLLKEVAKLGYDQNELEELRQAVVEDKARDETPTVAGGETGKWYMNALKKVGKSAVKVGVDVASNVIIKAVENFANGG